MGDRFASRAAPSATSAISNRFAIPKTRPGIHKYWNLKSSVESTKSLDNCFYQPLDIVRIGFGILWLFDGLLQAQPQMAGGMPSQLAA